MKKYINLNILVSIGLIVFGLAWLKLTFDLNSAGIGDSQIWGTGATIPQFLLAIFLVLNVWVLISEIRAAGKRRESESGAGDNSGIIVAGFIALLFVYTAVLPVAGYIASTIVLLVITMILFGERNKILIVAVPVCFTAFLYVVFKYILIINLP